MANRFRTAIKGTSEEILKSGKQKETDESSKHVNRFASTIEEKSFNAKDIEENLDKNQDKEIQLENQNELESISYKEEEEKPDHENDNTNFNKQNYFGGLRKILQTKNEENIKIKEDKSYQEVFNFLQDKINSSSQEVRFNKLKGICNALLEYKESGKPILLCDLKENIVFWIEAVKMSIPLKVADTMVFRTYPNTNNMNYANCSIYINEKEENSVRRSHSEYDPSLCVFNIVKGTGSKIKLNSDFSEFVLECYKKSETELASFRNFADKFDYYVIDNEIENCSKLFRIVNNGLDDIDYIGLQQAIDFADKYGSVETKRELLEKLYASNISDKKLVFQVFKFIFSLPVDENKVFYHKAYSFLFKCIQNLLSSNDTDKVIEINSSYNEIVNLIADKGDFADFVLGSDNIVRLTSYISDNEPKYAKFYLSIINSLIEKKNISWLDNEIFTGFIDKCLDVLLGDNGEIESIINSVCKTTEQMVNYILLYYNKIGQVSYNENDAIKLYIKKVNENHGKEEGTIRNLLFKNENGSSIIIDEFKIYLEKQENKKDFFWDYSIKVFERITGFKKKYFSEVVKIYLQAIINEPYYRDECYKIITLAVKEPELFNNEMVGILIDEYVNQLPFAKPDQLTERILSILSKIRIERNITSNTNIEELINFGIKLENANSLDNLRKLIINSMPDLEDVSLKRQEQFFNWCFNILSNNDNATVEEMLILHSKIKKLDEENSSSSTEFPAKTGRINNLMQELKNRIAKLDEGNNASSAEFEANEQKINSLILELKNMKVKEVQYYLITTLDFLASAKHSWNDNGQYENLIKACVQRFHNHKDEFEYILNYACSSDIYFSNLLILYSNIGEEDESNAIQYFRIKSKEIGEKWANNICVKIGKNLGDSKFLIEEFKSRFKEQTKKTTFFWNYTEEVFNNSPTYMEKCFSDVLEYYLSQIENEDVYSDECFKILEIAADGIVKLKSDVMTRIIKEYEKAIPLNFPGDDIEDIILEVENIKKASEVVTNPDIIGIMTFGIKIKNEEEPEKISEILKKASFDFGRMDKERYNEFIIWCLPMICNKINVIENDVLIKKIFYADAYKEEFLEIYNKIINEQLNIKNVPKSKNELKNILSRLNESSSVVANIIVEFYNQCESENDIEDAVELFTDVISKNEHNQEMAIRKDIYSINGGDRLFYAEFSCNLSKANDKTLFFEQYSKNIFCQMKDYMKKYFDKAVKEYIKEIKKLPSYADECYKLLNLIIKSNLEVDSLVLTMLISEYEQKISMEDINSDVVKSTVKNMEAIKERYNLTTEPDITKLLDFEIKLLNLSDEDKIRNLISKSSFNLNKISLNMYERCLDMCLPKCIDSVNLWTVHAAIKKLLYSENLKNVFFNKYIEVMNQEISLDEMYRFNILAQFIIYFFNNGEYYDDSLRNDIIKNISNVLINHPGINVKSVENVIVAETSGMKNKEIIVDGWNAVSTKYLSSKPEKGLFGKLFKK